MSNVNNTLYIKRIGEHVGITDMKRSIFSLFSPYGFILDIRANHSIKRRGQAWITYKQVESAIKAKNALNGYYMFDRPIIVEFATQRSVASLRMTGDYNPYGRKAETINPCEAPLLAQGHIPYHFIRSLEPVEEIESEVPHDVIIPETEEAIVPTVSLNKPNNVLFVQNIPEDKDTAQFMLDILFGQITGFHQVRIADLSSEISRIAFVEYETIEQARVALAQTDGADLDGKRIKVQFSK